MRRGNFMSPRLEELSSVTDTDLPLLHEAGVYTLRDLAEQNAFVLVRQLATAARSRRLHGQEPDVERVRGWIRDAQNAVRTRGRAGTR